MRQFLLAQRNFLLSLLCLGILSGCDSCLDCNSPRLSNSNFAQPLPSQNWVTGRAASGGTMVQLFMWRWDDIAQECEQQLPALGYTSVLVSPPNEHILTGARPWWERYQPVSYLLSSGSGSAQAFSDMVSRCKAKGIEIVADAVFNHMAASSSTSVIGFGGNRYSGYSYPAVPYSVSDFHTPCSVSNYNDAHNVQFCQLVGLPDLATEQNGVRSKIANYLIALNRLGVGGFRIDAAKHMPAADIDAILAIVNQSARVENRAVPYVFLEVINNSGEAVKASDYYAVGNASGSAVDVTDFQIGYRLSDAVLGRNGVTLSSLATELRDAQTAIPTDKALVFSDNHDNERGSNVRYQDGNAHLLANALLIASGYGYPVVLSGYSFDKTTQDGRDAGPNLGSDQLPVSVYGGAQCPASGAVAANRYWSCEHRNMKSAIVFRAATSDSKLLNWQTPSANILSFDRGSKGFAVFNNTSSAYSGALTSTLPAGNYCQAGLGCQWSVQVDNSGNAHILNSGVSASVPAKSALLFVL